ncbi:MAG: zf-HC2 domain-containing protein [Anaerolineaceae bacterium]|jgi:hypothetical protein|nr:MAG: zf-HC2 domain-containing protein [Anaerolineaceae bacterium]
MNKITRKEWLLLSRYLDGDLSAEQQRRVEERLRSDAEFKMTFERLAHTRRVLRSVPQRRIPHPYVLTAEMAGIRERRRAPQLVWQYSSAVAALVAVVALALQFFAPRASVISPVFDAAQPELQIMAAPELAGEAATEEPPIILWNPGIGGMGGGGEGSKSYPNAVAIPESTPAGTAFYGVGGGGAGVGNAAPTEGALSKGMEEPELAVSDEGTTMTQEEAVPEEEARSAAVPEGTNPILGIAPQEERGSIQADTTESALTEKSINRVFSRLNYGEIAISAAFISIGCGVVAFLLRRKQH